MKNEKQILHIRALNFQIFLTVTKRKRKTWCKQNLIIVFNYLKFKTQYENVMTPHVYLNERLMSNILISHFALSHDSLCPFLESSTLKEHCIAAKRWVKKRRRPVSPASPQHLRKPMRTLRTAFDIVPETNVSTMEFHPCQNLNRGTRI